MSNENWSERVIPLPKELQVLGSMKLAADSIAVVCDAEPSPEIKTALDLLGAFCRAKPDQASFTIQMTLSADFSAVNDGIKKRLSSLPNPDQAYAIDLLAENSGLLLIANTPCGLLYAARTLAQLVSQPGDVSPSTEVEIPLARVVDWPDIYERGQWGCEHDMAWTSQWKLNVLEACSRQDIDADGAACVNIDRDLFRQGSKLGVKVVPFISHIEQLSGHAGCKNSPDTWSKPDPSKPLPSDYVPGLCMSSPATSDLVAEWIDALARIPEVSDIMVWLSEERSPCFCDKCVGKEPFELEVGCIVSAFRKVQQDYPHIRLRLLTTQGSYLVNDKVLAAAPSDVGITYYDGSRTYDSSRNPMIYPLLADFAKSGRWLGVYPQITHSWRTVFPWTAPQFVRFRAQEFADKKLSCMIGYAIPSNRHHEFNLMAMAEWTWNARGRSPEEFCRAYAIHAGIRDPELFSRWAMAAGDAGWSLAESKLLLTAIYDPGLGLCGDVPFDHRFEGAALSNVADFEKAIALAREALALARQSANPNMIYESECALAGLEAFKAVKSASTLLSGAAVAPDKVDELSASLDMLDRCAAVLRDRIIAWGNGIPNESLHSRLVETAYVLLRTNDMLRAKACAIGIPDPTPEIRLKKIGGWCADGFSESPDAVSKIDISDMVPAAGGGWQIGFDFIQSAYGTDITKVCAVSGDGESETIVAKTPDPLARVSKYETWKEMRLDIPARPKGARLSLEIGLRGLPADAPAGRRTCSGSISIRRAPKSERS